jgi:hypothetical protein
VIGFAIFNVILREIFLQSLQPTEEENIEDLENMRRVWWIGEQHDPVAWQFPKNLLGTM